MRTSNPPSYDKIFQIYVASAATVTQYPTTVSSGTPVTDAMLIPLHRGLLVMTTAQVTVEFYNLDHKLATNKQSVVTASSSTVTIPSGTSIVLPLQIAYYRVVSGGASFYLYGLI
jgi:hypothetical protein